MMTTSIVGTARRLLITLLSATVVLAALCIYLGARLESQSRFVPLHSSFSPALMFDRKTAQTCYAGPVTYSKPKPSRTDLLADIGKDPVPENRFDGIFADSVEEPRPSGEPYCKSLK